MPSRATLTKTRGKDEGWAKSQASHSINANVNSDSWLLVQLLKTFVFTATCNFHQCRHADAVRRAPFSSAGPATKRSDEMCPATGDKCAPYSEHLRPAHVEQHWRSLSQLSIRIKGVSPVIHVICVLFLFLINQLVISWVSGCWKHNNQITKTDTPNSLPANWPKCWNICFNGNLKLIMSAIPVVFRAQNVFFLLILFLIFPSLILSSSNFKLEFIHIETFTKCINNVFKKSWPCTIVSGEVAILANSICLCEGFMNEIKSKTATSPLWVVQLSVKSSE